MSANSKIEWTDHTFNPWIGCTKVSPACDNCYAEVSTPSRTLGVAWGPHAERHRTSDSNWELPRRWNAQAEAFKAQHGRRQRVFCASLADVFDNAVPVQWRIGLMRLILETPHLDWLLLTKRIGNAAEMLDVAFRAVHAQREKWADNVPANVWLGATIATPEEADRDITKLLAVPAARRFLSMEPLLGPVKLPRFCACGCNKTLEQAVDEAMDGPSALNEFQARAAIETTLGIDWVIVGGESGPNARPMGPDWARSLRDQCQAAGVPFFFKQWGEHAPNWFNDDAGQKIEGSEWIDRMGKKAAGRLLDGREWNEVPA